MKWPAKVYVSRNAAKISFLSTYKKTARWIVSLPVTQPSLQVTDFLTLAENFISVE
jgi:hypothetical protein